MNKKELKTLLRKDIKNKRKNYNLSKVNDILVHNLKNTLEYKKSNNIMIYYPLKDEVNLLDLIKDNSKNFYLPKINNQDLLCCPYNKNDELYESCFKTKEPKTNSIDKHLIDLIIIPALAVDKDNYRLGFGGGFYDRFLANINAYKIVCIPKDFVLETIYPEKHDIKIDLIITE